MEIRGKDQICKNIPIRTEEGEQIREAIKDVFGFPNVDYTALELYMLALILKKDEEKREKWLKAFGGKP